VRAESLAAETERLAAEMERCRRPGVALLLYQKQMPPGVIHEAASERFMRAGMTGPPIIGFDGRGGQWVPARRPD